MLWDRLEKRYALISPIIHNIQVDLTLVQQLPHEKDTGK